jgi:hypothetical protein
MKKRSWTQWACSLWVIAFWCAGVNYEISQTNRMQHRIDNLYSTIPIFSIPLVILLFVFLAFPRARLIGLGGFLACVLLALVTYILTSGYFHDNSWTFALTIIYLYIGSFIALFVTLVREA